MESVLLELPIPPIFVIENEDGVLELIDGLQRVSSMIHFMDAGALNLQPLELQGCDLVTELNNNKFEDLPLKLKLRVRRSSIRTIMIKRQSSSMLRYEMFKRLNTGGAILAPQEIRNCTARMVGEPGIKFYKFLQDCSDSPQFKVTSEPLADADRAQKGDEELILRFLALKNGRDLFRGSVRDWLDDYMEQILLQKRDFDYVKEKDDFQKVFSFVAASLGKEAFVRHRDGNPIGGLAPAYYEAVSMALYKLAPEYDKLDKQLVKAAVVHAMQQESFRDVTGPGANSKQKLESRIQLVYDSIRTVL